MKRSAFTLIELLVVISIIAVLASLAVPALNKSIENGKATACRANVRQLAMGTIAYLADNDGVMFSAGGSWPTTLRNRYVPQWKAFRSPFDTRPDSELGNAPVSYGVNRNLFDMLDSRFGAPSQLIMFAAAPVQGAKLTFDGIGSGNPSVAPVGDPKGGTHNGRRMLNVAFCDGGAQSMNMSDFTNAGNLDGQRRWFPEGMNQQ